MWHVSIPYEIHTSVQGIFIGFCWVSASTKFVLASWLNHKNSVKLNTINFCQDFQDTIVLPLINLMRPNVTLALLTFKDGETTKSEIFLEESFGE